MNLEEAARALLADYDAGAIFNQEAGITTLGWPELEALRVALGDTPKMVEVTAADANKYCRVLSALGMEEEGDPVQEIESLKDALASTRAERDSLRSALNPRGWTRAQSDAWHRALPDTERAFRALHEVSVAAGGER